MKLHGIEIDDFTQGYIEAALWSTNDESTPAGGEPLDANYSEEDLVKEAVEKIVADCAKFQAAHAADLAQARRPDYNGHDFWLTRNGHGAGFWDRGLGEVGDRLSEAARRSGEVHLYIGDDGKIHTGG